MQEKILNLLNENPLLNEQEIATRLGLALEEVQSQIAIMKETGILLGYQAVIDWEKTDKEMTTAMIEVRVTPQRGQGFDRIAKRLYEYPEVDSCYLMSGGFDLMVILKGKTLRDVANFVSDRIAPLESVLSTSTHFILKQYKSNGRIFANVQSDDREAIVL